MVGWIGKCLRCEKGGKFLLGFSSVDFCSLFLL